MSETEPSRDVSPSSPPAEIGWLRAIASGLAIVVVGIGGAVYGADRILTKALGLRRTPREYLAVALFLLVVIVLAWLLERKLI